MTQRFDVVVVGGGSAGVAAALAAAEQGVRCLLLEASDRLGGNVSLALVHTICGLYHRAEPGAPRLAHPGLPSRLLRELRAEGAVGEPERAGRVLYLPLDPSRYAGCLRKLCERCSGLEVRLGAPLEGIREAGRGFLLSSRGQPLEAHAVIDASGDARVAELLGAGRVEEPASALQAPAYIVELGGVEPGSLVGFERLQLSAAVARAVRAGRLPEDSDSVVVRPGLRPDGAFLTLGVAKPAEEPYRPLDPAQRQRLEYGARERAKAVIAHLRASRPGFAAARVVRWPERLGLRETARGRSLVELDRDDVLQGRRRDDEVAISTWPIELWRDHRRARFLHPEAACSVPLGALVSADHPGLGFAGRCMGGSQEALAALRVIGTSLATGEAVGVAAALAAAEGVGLVRVRPESVRARIVAGGGAEGA